MSVVFCFKCNNMKAIYNRIGELSFCPVCKKVTRHILLSDLVSNISHFDAIYISDNTDLEYNDL